MIKNKLPYLLCLLFIFFSLEVANASYYGRFTSGGFISKEVFRASEIDRYNDVAVFSERLYLSVDKVAESNHELNIDLRDKHNFFDKLDTEKLRLTSSNKFQAQQLSLRSIDDFSKYKYQIGRFAENEAGSAMVDGIDFGLRDNFGDWANKASFFIGFNPASTDETELKFNADAKTIGIYDVLQTKLRSFEKYIYLSNALVRQSYKSEVDRTYIFNNTVVQDGGDQNFTSMLYLDIEPHINIQNWWSSYAVTLKNNYKVRTNISTIDSLHYRRAQDIRETLPSSRYNQASAALRLPSLLDHNAHEAKISFGVRAVDDKKRIELKWGTYLPQIFPQFFKEDLSANLNAGLRKNFISNDTFVGFGFVNSNKLRELSFNQDVIIEKRSDLGTNIAFITDASYTKFYTRTLFGILSLQNTWDKKVSIFSILFKISYRFGEGGQAPIREGSAPMGQL